MVHFKSKDLRQTYYLGWYIKKEFTCHSGQVSYLVVHMPCKEKRIHLSIWEFSGVINIQSENFKHELSFMVLTYDTTVEKIIC